MKIKRTLIILVVFLVVFSTGAVATGDFDTYTADDFVRDTYVICNDARYFDILANVEACQRDYLPLDESEVLDELLFAKRRVFSMFRDWNLLQTHMFTLEAEKYREQFGSLEKAVSTFFGTRIGAISYGIFLLEGEGKYFESPFFKHALSGLLLAEEAAYRRVLHEIEKLGYKF